jgi:hypothetical protein
MRCTWIALPVPNRQQLTPSSKPLSPHGLRSQTEPNFKSLVSLRLISFSDYLLNESALPTLASAWYNGQKGEEYREPKNTAT